MVQAPKELGAGAQVDGSTACRTGVGVGSEYLQIQMYLRVEGATSRVG